MEELFRVCHIPRKLIIQRMNPAAAAHIATVDSKTALSCTAPAPQAHNDASQVKTRVKVPEASGTGQLMWHMPVILTVTVFSQCRSLAVCCTVLGAEKRAM